MLTLTAKKLCKDCDGHVDIKVQRCCPLHFDLQ